MTRSTLQLAGGIVIGLAAFAASAATESLNPDQWPFKTTPRATLSEPWAMAFLPDGTALITEKRGALKHVDVKTGQIHDVEGVPKVAYGGQGGLGDVILHPDYAGNQTIYLSFGPRQADAESGR